MYWDARFVKPLSDFRIDVEVEDGRKGIFDMKPYLDRGVARRSAAQTQIEKITNNALENPEDRGYNVVAILFMGVDDGDRYGRSGACTLN